VIASLFEADGSVIPTKGNCTVTITVVGDSTTEPEPEQCSEETWTAVPDGEGGVDYYDGDVWCASVKPNVTTPKVVTPTPAATSTPVAELPQTGFGTTELAFLGISLFLIGWASCLISASRKEKFS
jgi:LPXTG-motif cell wall-anchored protein